MVAVRKVQELVLSLPEAKSLARGVLVASMRRLQALTFELEAELRTAGFAVHTHAVRLSMSLCLTSAKPGKLQIGASSRSELCCARYLKWLGLRIAITIKRIHHL